MVPEPEAWHAQADPPPEPFEAIRRQINLPIPSNAQLVYPRNCSPFVLVVAHDTRTGSGYASLYDLRSTSTRENFRVVFAGNRTYDAQWVLSDDGRHCAYRKRGEPGITIVPLQEGAAAWNVPASSSAQWVFAGADKLVVSFRRETQLIMEAWSLTERSQLWQVSWTESREVDTLAASPGGKYLAFVAQRRLYLMRSADGVPVGSIALPRAPKSITTAYVTGTTVANVPEYRGLALAFSPDGSQLAGLLEGYPSICAVCWDVATGRMLLAQPDYRDALYGARGTAGYSGLILEWVPDASGWLWKGHILVDRESGRPYYVLPGTTHDPRRMLAPDRILVMRLAGLQRALTSVEIPKQELDKGLAAVRAGGEGTDALLPPLKQCDASTAPVRVVPSQPVAWQVPVLQASAAESLKWFQRPVTLGSPGQMPPSDVCFFVGDKGGFACTVSKGKEHELRRYDAAGQVSKSISLPAAMKLLDMAPSGNVAVLSLPYAWVGPAAWRSLLPDRNVYDRLDVYSFSPTRHVVGFRPYAGEPALQYRAVRSLLLIDDEHLLTSNLEGKCILWKLPECQPLYQFTSFQWQATSPDRRYLFATSGKEMLVYVYDALTGECVGTTESVASQLYLHDLSIRPDGRYAVGLATHGGSGARPIYLALWSLENGKLVQQFPVNTPYNSLNQVRWCGDQYIICGGEYLVSLQNRAVFWHVKLDASMTHPRRAPEDRHYWALTRFHDATNRGQAVLGWFTIPSPTAAAAAPLQTLESQLIARRGDAVRIDASPEYHEILSHSLLRSGYRVDPAASVTAKVSVSEERSGNELVFVEGRRSPSFFPGFSRSSHLPTQEYRVAERRLTAVVQLVDAKGRIWQRERSVSIGSTYQVLDNQNLDSVIDSSLHSGIASWLESQQFPELIFARYEDLGIGSSRLTAQGEVLVSPPGGSPAAGP